VGTDAPTTVSEQLAMLDLVKTERQEKKPTVDIS